MESMKTGQHQNLSYRIQLLRDETGWNLSEIARRAMVSPQAVQQWAKGDTAPSGERLKRLAAASGKPEHWFFMAPDEELHLREATPTYNVSRNQLDEKEIALLALFNQMPEAEKNRLIVHAKTTLKELDLLKDDVSSIIKNISK